MSRRLRRSVGAARTSELMLFPEEAGADVREVFAAETKVM